MQKWALALWLADQFWGFSGQIPIGPSNAFLRIRYKHSSGQRQETQLETTRRGLKTFGQGRLMMMELMLDDVRMNLSGMFRFKTRC